MLEEALSRYARTIDAPVEDTTQELAGLVVLHLDKGFERIAEITSQPLERLAP